MGEQVNKNVPAIRFKGFSENWQAQEIGDVVEEKKRPIVLNDHQSYELITVKRRNGGVVSRGHLLGKEILVKNYYQLQENDFVISKRQVVHGATGIITKELDKAIVSNEYLVAVSNDRLTTEFLNLLSCQPKLKKDFFLSSYGVDIEKLFFDAEDWKKRSISLPTKKEQQKIGSFFQQLDTELNLHQTKLDKLDTLKQAMLQKMFPQGNATEPEIRFKGFSGEWKCQQLGNISDSFSGGTPTVGVSSYYGGNIPFIRSAEISSSSTQLSLTEEGLANSSAKMVEKGNILYALYGATSGEVGIAKIRGAINQAVLCITPHKGFDAGFLALWLYRQKSQIISTFLQGGQGNLSGSIIKSLMLLVPVESEQQKISDYFRKLDELIALKRTQLDKLKQIKQACLVGMFV